MIGIITKINITVLQMHLYSYDYEGSFDGDHHCKKSFPSRIRFDFLCNSLISNYKKTLHF
jgi:hypothetical protein